MTTKTKKLVKKEKKDSATIERIKAIDPYKETSNNVLTRFKKADNIDLDNKIFFRPNTTASIVYYLYLKYTEAKISDVNFRSGERIIELNRTIKDKEINPFMKSDNPLGRISRMTSRIRELKNKLNGELKTSKEVRKIINEKILKIVDK